MLDDAARVSRYLDQTNRGDLTPRQRRRAAKKRRSQSSAAFDKRAVKAAEKADRREQRKARLAGLTPAA
ncbi:hypothetical protein ACIBQX_11795 [Nonomuraea sp. NPDC049714]|uniref:hypothetical protein n=1 Tax=Nonomuraea sp. NPDC049714 TaxID=3364357 RepID=UPI0037A80EFD